MSNMHRSYQPILPTHNKFLQQRWDQIYYNEHRRRVKTSTPKVDTKAPQTHLHLHLKLKKLQLEEERLATIERDNRILLEKMSYIMRARGRIDNRNDYEYKSLNREKRQRELLRITRENHSILQRIMARPPEYSTKKLQEDWEKNLKFMDSISMYPKDWWHNHGIHKNKRSRSKTDSQITPRSSRSQDGSRAASRTEERGAEEHVDETTETKEETEETVEEEE